jgi:hypothetical protein
MHWIHFRCFILFKGMSFAVTQNKIISRSIQFFNQCVFIFFYVAMGTSIQLVEDNRRNLDQKTNLCLECVWIWFYIKFISCKQSIRAPLILRKIWRKTRGSRNFHEMLLNTPSIQRNGRKENQNHFSFGSQFQENMLRKKKDPLIPHFSIYLHRERSNV